MKGHLQHFLLILILAVMAILARPCLVFASQSLNAPLGHQSSALDLRQVVRKRNEYTFSQDESIVSDDIRKKAGVHLLSSFFSFLSKLQVSLRMIRSYISPRWTAHFKQRATVFQISPHNDRYINLSVFRI